MLNGGNRDSNYIFDSTADQYFGEGQDYGALSIYLIRQQISILARHGMVPKKFVAAWHRRWEPRVHRAWKISLHFRPPSSADRLLERAECIELENADNPG
jgi:hypothetical protein